LKEAKKAEKARIKANQKAIREAEKIARLAEKADALEKGANNSSVSSVKAAPASINDVFESAGARNREDDYETGGRTAEEKSIDNSVDDELAGLGLDNFFGEIEEEPTNQNDNFSSYGNIAREEEPDDDSDEEEISSIKEKKTKPAKAKKPKKVKPPKPSKQKKPKKPKEPDEIIMLPKGLIILGLSFTVLIAAVATVGGNYSHYNKCMAKAVAYYVDKDYKSAYSQLAGLKIREEDEFFYQQLKVVMNVEANYDLFKSYMRIGLFEEALDALLKGVDNFDLYQNEARDWEAFDDLEVSLRRVVNALNKYFGITESRAREINLTDSQREYSKIVAELAANVVYDKNEPFEDETTTAGEIPSSDSGEDETTDESAGDNSEE